MLLYIGIFPEQRIKFSSPCFFFKFPGAIVGYRDSSLLLDTTHLHAEVTGFYHNDDTFGGQCFGETLAYLSREPLLYLKPAGKHLDETSDLAEADNFPIRDITYMDFPEERQ